MSYEPGPFGVFAVWLGFGCLIMALIHFFGVPGLLVLPVLPFFIAFFLGRNKGPTKEEWLAQKEAELMEFVRTFPLEEQAHVYNYNMTSYRREAEYQQWPQEKL